MGGDAREAIKKVRQKREAAKKQETMEEAWERIFAMRNSDADLAKLREVRDALSCGEISRESPEKRFTKAEALRLWQILQERRRQQKIDALVRATPPNYHLIQTEEKLNWLLRLLEDEPIIAVDTETTGVDVFVDEIVGISLTLPRADVHVYIPVAHKTSEPQLPRDLVLRRLRPFLESPFIDKVLHNAKFDIHMFIRHGIRLRGLKHDTMVAMVVLNENEESYALKNLVVKYLKVEADTFETLFGKTPFYEIPLNVALVYAAKDTDLTWRLYQFQREHLEKRPKLYRLYYELENPLIDVCVDMEQAGFVLDVDYARQLSKELRQEIADLERQMKEHFGDINFNSPVQLSHALYDVLKLPDVSGKRSTDEATLKALQNHNPGIPLLLKYRELNKLLRTYVEALPQQLKPDGKIHGSFNQAATVTGRFASRDPNLQNQPKFARKLFVAPPGKVLVGIDFSQIEPRVLAHMSGDERMQEPYKKGQDLYATLASRVFNKPIEECGDGSKWRKMMKVGLLATMYGTGMKTLAQQLEISVEEARDFIESFYRAYPRVKQWIDEQITFCRRYGYVETLFGRKRRLPQIRSRDEAERYRAERQCINSIIQGSAADIMKRALLNLHEYCKAKGWDVIATVHDEALMLVDEDITLEEIEDLERCMTSAAQLSVPLKTDTEIMRRWGEGVSKEEWFAQKGVVVN